jgi:hypothetical protein
MIRNQLQRLYLIFKLKAQEDNGGTIYIDLYGLPEPPGPGTQWIQLLSNAAYYGTREPPGYSPLAIGRFSKLMAVYRSGYITACDSSTRSKCPAFRPNHPWQNYAECGETTVSFELKVGGSYVVQQPQPGCDLPPECQPPTEPDGNIVCVVDFMVTRGDLLVPTWFEASNAWCTGECRVRLQEIERAKHQFKTYNF